MKKRVKPKIDRVPDPPVPNRAHTEMKTTCPPAPDLPGEMAFPAPPEFPRPGFLPTPGELPVRERDIDPGNGLPAF